MNNDTGHIHQMPEGIRAFVDSIPKAEIPIFGFTPLGNEPVVGCDKCKGTGVARIMASGRRIPCTCTNPQ